MNRTQTKKQALLSFIKEWALVIAILAGVAGYFVYVSVPMLDATHAAVGKAISVAQPLLIFAMLLLTFCRIDLRQMRLQRWHLWLLAIQCGLFAGIGCVLVSLPHSPMRVILEGAMICLICPTATAAAVVTGRLGGDVHHITTYTILINISAAVLIPAMLPFVHPNPAVTPLTAALMILSKVFPLLLLPLLTAMLMRRLTPGVCRRLAAKSDLSFYLWAVALSLAIAVTTRSIVHCTLPGSTLWGLVGVSLASCVLQFWLGRAIGRRYGATVTAGQSLGQKNTVLAIWLGYTFFTPVTAIVGGFYSIWHNLYNTLQLHRASKSR